MDGALDPCWRATQAFIGEFIVAQEAKATNRYSKFFDFSKKLFRPQVSFRNRRRTLLSSLLYRRWIQQQYRKSKYMAKPRLKPVADQHDIYSFLAKIRDPNEIRLIRAASAGLGYPSNATLLHLLAESFLKTNKEMML
jgi:hypothetical protein